MDFSTFSGYPFLQPGFEACTFQKGDLENRKKRMFLKGRRNNTFSGYEN